MPRPLKKTHRSKKSGAVIENLDWNKSALRWYFARLLQKYVPNDFWRWRAHALGHTFPEKIILFGTHCIRNDARDRRSLLCASVWAAKCQTDGASLDGRGKCTGDAWSRSVRVSSTRAGNRRTPVERWLQGRNDRIFGPSRGWEPTDGVTGSNRWC